MTEIAEFAARSERRSIGLITALIEANLRIRRDWLTTARANADCFLEDYEDDVRHGEQALAFWKKLLEGRR